MLANIVQNSRDRQHVSLCIRVNLLRAGRPVQETKHEHVIICSNIVIMGQKQGFREKDKNH